MKLKVSIVIAIEVEKVDRIDGTACKCYFLLESGEEEMEFVEHAGVDFLTLKGLEKAIRRARRR